MKKLHDKYGPAVRFGPTDLSYTSAQAWQDVHGPKVQEKAQEFSVQPVNGTYEKQPKRITCDIWREAVLMKRQEFVVSLRPSIMSMLGCGVSSPQLSLRGL